MVIFLILFLNEVTTKPLDGNIIPLTDDDRSHIERDLYSFKVEQYGVYEDTPLYFNFMYAQFLGYDGEGVKLYIRGHVSGFAVSYIGELLWVRYQ